MYICEYFKIEELVPEAVYNERGDLAWQLFDTRLLENLDALREQLDTYLIMNTWYSQNMIGNYGLHDQRGLRAYLQKHWGKYSQHTFGRAADPWCPSISSEEIRRRIREKEIVLPHPVWIELGTRWVHMDVRNSKDQVRFFNP